MGPIFGRGWGGYVFLAPLKHSGEDPIGREDDKSALACWRVVGMRWRVVGMRWRVGGMRFLNRSKNGLVAF